MKIFISVILAVSAVSASAQVYVQPHVTRNGTYIEGYQRTAPNETRLDNYSSQGNVNPYTGQAGTVNPYAQPANPYQHPAPTSNIWGEPPARQRSAF